METDRFKDFNILMNGGSCKCTNEILSGLGKMYAGGGEFTENINKMGGEGTAEFTHRAIQIYCG